eukprot:scaffold14038_cov110-Isochrysis_galbana.AAC.2
MRAGIIIRRARVLCVACNAARTVAAINALAGRGARRKRVGSAQAPRRQSQSQACVRVTRR